jgi:DNA-binding HxlR family transcriptional regulator
MKRTNYTCGLDAAIDLIGGKWKPLLLWALMDGPVRFGELKRAVPGISERVLVLQLKQLEASGLIHRELYHQVPPKVEYSLTDFGKSALDALAPLGIWGEANMALIEAIPRELKRRSDHAAVTARTRLTTPQRNSASASHTRRSGDLR